MLDWVCQYLGISDNIKPALYHKVVLGLTLSEILSKVDKPINAEIHVRNVGTQFSGITYCCDRIFTDYIKCTSLVLFHEHF